MEIYHKKRVEDDAGLLEGRGYRILEIVRETESGAIYRVLDHSSGEYVICKKQNNNLLYQEAEILGRDRGRLLPRCIEYFVEGEDGFLMMEELEGVSLSDWLGRKGCMKAGAVGRLGIKLSDQMRGLYERTGITCHGDLKPEHIWKKGRRIRILDVGASYRKGASPGFGAPERLFGREADHEREDIYSIGAVLVYMMLGELPDERTLKLLGREAFRGQGKRLMEVLIRAMEREPLKRVQTMEELNKLLKETGYPWKNKHGKGDRTDERLYCYKDIWEG